MSAEPTIAEQLASHGFHFEGTGGGCTAYVRRDGDLSEFVTLAGDATAPDALADEILVGNYEDGEQLDTVRGYTLNDALIALANPYAEYALLTLRLVNDPLLKPRR